jgi:hypothetical protein
MTPAPSPRPRLRGLGRASELQPPGLVLCPDCPPVRTAREMVLAESFWLNALYMVLPFVAVVLALVVVAVRLDRSRP